jgi:hypothetical protein
MSYRAAQEQEFAKNAKSSNDELAESAQEELFRLLPDAMQALRLILINPDKDSDGISAAKLVLEYTIGKPSPTKSDSDSLDKIIRGLMAPTVTIDTTT